jgi:methionine-rich copper-binding protein CopC
LSLDAPDLPPARYIVRYRVLSTDGHIVEGNYEFTVDAK